VSATAVWLVLRDPVCRNALAAFLVRGAIGVSQ
jgi:hypothetical protein